MMSHTVLYAQRSIDRSIRNPALIVAAVAFPIVLMFVMLIVFSEVVEETIDTPYVARVVPLIILSTASFSASATAVGVLLDRTNGLIDRFRTITSSPWSILFGRVLGDLVRVLASTILVIAVAHLVGFRFSQGAPAAIAFIGVAASAGFMWISFSTCLGLYAPAEDALQALNAPTTLLFFLSSGFVPEEQFPGALQPIVHFNPLSSTTEALIGLSAGGPVAGPLALSLGLTMGMGMLSLTIAARKFHQLTNG